ncbi:tetratricopeptide repeat protein [Kribbella voronezhensis]|uniref:tetratricopeptide repeat protein n=1 Tax=Kribbella voronezhensis TaxID=2512212 RepID=UPI001416FE08|nr:tetratricopeptide repeat protein [Kribbella voronezhensis]
MGKTSIALEYAHRHLAEVGVGWQLPAEDPAVLAASFGELAAQLGVRELLDTADPVAAVHGALRAYPAEWMLVFDNAPSRSSVASFLPPAGRGRVLITSRDQIWPPGQSLDVPMLDRKVAAEFLVNRTGDPDRKAALELADELGGLPLALEQAAAYIQATVGTLAGYLVAFRERRDELLARGEPTGYDETVATTWSLALQQLGASSPGAAGLLRLLACLAPDPVPLTLLLADEQLADQLAPSVTDAIGQLLGDPVAVGDAAAALRRYSLLTAAGNGMVSVHRLVQHVTLAQEPANAVGQWRQAAGALVEAAIPADPDLPEGWPVFALLLPHARAVLDLISSGMWRIALYSGHSGNPTAARDLFQLIADAHLQSDTGGPEHRDALAARNELAYWTGQAGELVEALDQFAELLPIFERLLGPEHPGTLTARNNLAARTGEAGDAAGARDQFAELVSIRERVLGPEHPSTLITRNNLASWSGEAGDAAGARDQFAELLSIRERVLGPEHPSTLTTRNNLASWSGQAGDAAGARDQFAELLSIFERLLGPEHPDTLITRGNLASWSGQLGDAAGARDQFAELLSIFERLLGPEHPSTLITRGNLASWSGQAGDAAGARDQFAELLPIFERLLGPEHPGTLTTRNNLASWSGQAGDAAGARDQFAELLPIFERVLGPEHPDTLTTRGNLAYWTGEAGEVADAGD